jgi:hypothetical protein
MKLDGCPALPWATLSSNYLSQDVCRDGWIGWTGT